MHILLSPFQDKFHWLGEKHSARKKTIKQKGKKNQTEILPFFKCPSPETCGLVVWATFQFSRIQSHASVKTHTRIQGKVTVHNFPFNNSWFNRQNKTDQGGEKKKKKKKTVARGGELGLYMWCSTLNNSTFLNNSCMQALLLQLITCSSCSQDQNRPLQARLQHSVHILKVGHALARVSFHQNLQFIQVIANQTQITSDGGSRETGPLPCITLSLVPYYSATFPRYRNNYRHALYEQHSVRLTD